MINDTTGISEEERKLMEDKTSNGTIKVHFHPEIKIGDN